MLRLSIQARQALARLSLPLLIAASLVLMLLGRAQPSLGEAAREHVQDALAPVFGALAAPVTAARSAAATLQSWVALHHENLRLAAENERLRRWYDVALALDAENAELKSQLHWVPDPALHFITARVVADSGGVYARSVLVSAGPNHSVRKRQVALDATGLVGRVTESGSRSARILLITDINSRIPVMLEQSRGRAILAGTNGARPRLLYLPEGVRPEEGERVLTTAEANAFPAGLTVGTVRWSESGVPEVAPAAQLDRLSTLRIFDYGLDGIAPPEAPGRKPAGDNAATPAPLAAPR